MSYIFITISTRPVLILIVYKKPKQVIPRTRLGKKMPGRSILQRTRINNPQRKIDIKLKRVATIADTRGFRV